MSPHVQLSCLFNLFQSGTASQSLLSFMTLTFEKGPGQSSPMLDVRVSLEGPSDSQPIVATVRQQETCLDHGTPYLNVSAFVITKVPFANFLSEVS